MLRPWRSPRLSCCECRRTHRSPSSRQYPGVYRPVTPLTPASLPVPLALAEPPTSADGHSCVRVGSRRRPRFTYPRHRRAHIEIALDRAPNERGELLIAEGLPPARQTLRISGFGDGRRPCGRRVRNWRLIGPSNAAPRTRGDRHDRAVAAHIDGNACRIVSCHSCRSASMGLRLAARRAGKKPKTMPTAAENTNASAMML